MTATNHALTGAVIGAAIGLPWVALPAAFLSHYVLDALPHFGASENYITTARFKQMLAVDALLCVIFVAVLAFTSQEHWPLLAACAFLGTSPDLFWINKYRYALQGRIQQWKPNLHSRFAARIQWFEKPIGSVIELAWSVGMITLLLTILRK
jgi:hypothetical protein